MKAIVLKCKPGASFHFGKVGIDEETSLNDTSLNIPSDTIFSALVQTVAEAAPDHISSFIEWFQQGKIKISSGFFVLETGQGLVYFLPKPLSFNLARVEDHKKLKKVAFISMKVWVKGWGPDKWFSDQCMVIQNQFVCLKEELSSAEKIDCLFSLESMPKVAVHKETKEDSIYYQTNVQLLDLTPHNLLLHYYFLYEVENGFPAEEEFLMFVNLMASRGIGGQKSTGAGEIEEVEVNDVVLPTGNEAKRYCSLSLIIPRDASEFKKFQNYNLVMRGGRNIGYGNYQLKRIRMLEEGAVLNQEVEGVIVNIKPDQIEDNYFRSGKALLVPMNE